MSAAEARRNAVAALLGMQDSQGWWWGRMYTNVTLDVEDLLLRELYGIGRPDLTEATARWIRSQQREDGTWAVFPGGPGELSATVEAYLALRLSGDAASAPHMVRAASFCREQGGLQETRMATRIWLAALGLWPWDDLPALPPEIVLAPDAMPLSVASFSAWTRVALVPLSLVRSARPVHRVAVTVEELQADTHRARPSYPRWSVENAFVQLDRVLRRYERRPVGRLRRRARVAAERWIIDHQEVDGTWNGVHLLTVFTLFGLYASGYPVDHPVVRKALKGLAQFEVWEDTREGPQRRMECVTGPVWDTALAVLALTDADPHDREDTGQAVDAAIEWLLDKEVTVRGDWSRSRPRLAAGAWSFSFVNDQFPDCDDTAGVLLALQRAERGRPPDPRRAQARGRAAAWLVGMQSDNGGWGSFDVNSSSRLADKLPFCDFGEATDPPSVDVSAHVLEALAGELPADHPCLRRGLEWLLGQQEDDGAWFGRWSANYTYGTSAALNALAVLGATAATAAAVEHGRAWLLEHQNADGGWGEDLRSYDDPSWRGRGASTPSQTGWALQGLHAAGCRADDAGVSRGLGWLQQHQRADGTWEEEPFTGTGFPGDFYMGYPMYRMVFPVSALGRFYAEGSAPSVLTSSSHETDR